MRETSIDRRRKTVILRYRAVPLSGRFILLFRTVRLYCFVQTDQYGFGVVLMQIVLLDILLLFVEHNGQSKYSSERRGIRIFRKYGAPVSCRTAGNAEHYGR